MQASASGALTCTQDNAARDFWLGGTRSDELPTFAFVLNRWAEISFLPSQAQALSRACSAGGTAGSCLPGCVPG